MTHTEKLAAALAEEPLMLDTEDKHFSYGFNGEVAVGSGRMANTPPPAVAVVVDRRNGRAL